ncbi:chromate efflux transporter [Corynebacterium sp. 335C]
MNANGGEVGRGAGPGDGNGGARGTGGSGGDAGRGRLGEVAGAFGVLGLTSFGGPTAHLGYFRDEFVGRRRWLADRDYADVVALCQFLPGPASSQVGMALGWRRAGLPGMLAAFLLFTLPSAVVLALAAWGVTALGDVSGPVAGLKAAAVAVVAIALRGMVGSLVTGRVTAALAVGALALMLLVPDGWGTWAQIAAIVAAGAVGAALLTNRRDGGDDAGDDRHVAFRVPAWPSVAAGVAFAAGLAWSFLPGDWGVYYRTGALVFGGGHVVLPLLEDGVVPHLVSPDDFLAGYGLAQAVPGPLFTFASYLGALHGGPLGAVLATVLIFLPSMLLLVALMPLWARLASAPAARGAVAGAGAAVVGLLGAAFYDPVWTAGVTSPATFVVAVASLAALTVFRAPAWAVVPGAGLVGWALP